ncbi:MAG: V-type ATP synthase subunit E family protein [Candidatus Zapsychrus exili]|nr:V-type ATP synthase subunit E family protein [Candidatus Zapsychrus exili]
MTQQIQELINKIKSEGVEEAQSKAQEIEADAQSQSKIILEDAKKKAEKMINDANAEIEKTEQASKMNLLQASRDVVLSLREELQNILSKVVSKNVKSSLSADKLSKIIEDIIEKSAETKSLDESIEVVLSPKDLDSLKESLLSGLGKKLEGKIELKASEDISSGFTISFDEGKSCFDFTDESLTEYLSVYLNSQLSDLINNSK